MSCRGKDFYYSYYKAQNIIKDDEIEEFKSITSSELPASFWICCPINQNNLYSGILTRKITDLLKPNEIEESLQMLNWGFIRDTFQMNISRHQIKKNESLVEVKKLIFNQMEAGFLRRQESVSMIPPLLLDIKPQYKILDLCSSPGSKTAQILEYLAAENNDIFHGGFVIANDNNLDRCFTMLHQLQSMSFPNLCVTCSDARFFPILKDLNGSPVFFDRILADVPCSGDGTVRKSPDILRSWTSAGAISLHRLQKDILKRGIQLLAVGGRIVYSTCSLNPIEDEAVVSNVLAEDDSVRLIPPDFTGTLISSPGLDSWKVITREGEVRDWDSLPEKMRKGEYKTIFPPKNVDMLNLHYCRRVLPHFQNTGGFFYAVIEKVGHSRFEDSEATWSSPKRTKKDGRVNPFIEECSPIPESIVSEIKASYGLDFISDGALKFRGKSQKTVLIVNEPLAELIEVNHSLLRVIGIGVRAFKKQEDSYRLTSSVVNTLFFGHKISKKVIFFSVTDILTILSSETVSFDELSAESVQFISKENPRGFIIVRCCGLNYSSPEECELPLFVSCITNRTIKHMVDKFRRDAFMLIYRGFLHN